MKSIKVFVNDGFPTKGVQPKRKIIEAELVKEFPTTFLVRLPDGNEILRKKSRDLPEGETL